MTFPHSVFLGPTSTALNYISIATEVCSLLLSVEGFFFCVPVLHALSPWPPWVLSPSWNCKLHWLGLRTPDSHVLSLVFVPRLNPVDQPTFCSIPRKPRTSNCVSLQLTLAALFLVFLVSIWTCAFLGVQHTVEHSCAALECSLRDLLKGKRRIFWVGWKIKSIFLHIFQRNRPHVAIWLTGIEVTLNLVVQSLSTGP